jgi:hypothetical protein
LGRWKRQVKVLTASEFCKQVLEVMIYVPLYDGLLYIVQRNLALEGFEHAPDGTFITTRNEELDAPQQLEFVEKHRYGITALTAVLKVALV